MRSEHPLVTSLHAAIDSARDDLSRIRIEDLEFEYTNVASEELANSVKEYAEAIHSETIAVMKQDSSRVVTDAHVRRARSRIRNREQTSAAKISATLGGLVGGTGASTFISALTTTPQNTELVIVGFVLTILGVGFMVWGLFKE